jgi:hypothetical protein
MACSAGRSPWSFVMNRRRSASALNTRPQTRPEHLDRRALTDGSTVIHKSHLQRIAKISAEMAVAGSVEGGDAQVAVKAPEARIVVTGYPFLFEPADDLRIKSFNEATALLNEEIEQAVAATREADVKIVYVDVTAAFAGHGIGSSDPFINDPSSDARCSTFHPNADGYVAYADAIAAKLPNGWLDKNKQLV